MIERRCTKCDTWNDDRDYCSNCNNPLSSDAVYKKKKAESPPPEPGLDEYLVLKAKNARFWIVKIFFYSVYGVTITVIAIGGIMAYIVGFFAG